MMSAKTMQRTGDGLVRVSGGACLEELYAAIPDGKLYVEPLSAKQPLSEFLAEGGLGFGSLRHGTFAGQLCKVSGSREGHGFSYGLGEVPLYNVGYPLQRIMEGDRRELLKGRFGGASEMVLRWQKAPQVAVKHSASEICELPAADGAENVLFVNAAAAGAMSFPGSGVVEVRPSEEAVAAEAWSKRFVLDRLPGGQAQLAVLTQPSGAKKVYEAHRAAHAEGLFLALAVHLGVLVVASAPAAGVEELWKRASGLPMTWRLGGAS